MEKVSESIAFNKTKDQKHKIFCAACKRETNHIVLQSVDSSASIIGHHDSLYDNHPQTIDWSDNYQVIQCLGCDIISFRHVSYFSENVCQIGPHEWDNGTSTTLYPNRSDKTRLIRSYYKMPRTLRRIYQETIECFNNNALTLCAAGLRAIIEGICENHKIIDGPVQFTKSDGSINTERRKNLEGKIAGLSEKGILTQSNAAILHEHRFLGNKAVHELKRPALNELILAIEIVEHIFEALYEMPDKGAELQCIREKSLKK